MNAALERVAASDSALVVKTHADQGRGMDFVLSDATVDRYGDSVDAAGWQLGWFKQNPIALFGHNHMAPIGTWKDVRVEKGRLVGTLVLAARGTSARIDELHGLVDQGVLRAVSVGFIPSERQPISKDADPNFGPFKYTRQELLECSLVSVPANPAALAVARSLNISTETWSLAFGEQAEGTPGDRTAPGEQAAKPPIIQKALKMTTLAERIVDAEADLVVKKDKLAELNASENYDIDAVNELNTQIDRTSAMVVAMKASEAKIGINSTPSGGSTPPAPHIARTPLGYKQKEVNGFELMVRAMTVRGIQAFDGKHRSLDAILDERYPGHEATAIVTKADQTIGTTTVSGWASQIVHTVYADFLQALIGYSIYPALRDRGIGLSFDGIGTVSIPSRTAGGAGGGFVAEGSPIRVGRITTAALTLTPRKLGVIVPFSRELAKRSTPMIETLVRQAILEDTGSILDAALLDATAGDTARPAGLLNGVSAVASGYGGADYAAVINDLGALLAPFYAANAADNITVLMNPAQGLALSMMPGPGDGRFGWANGLIDRINIVESTRVTANRLIAIRNSDFVTANGDAPEFDVSDTATVHMEDTTPLELVSAAGTVADPTRSFFQTATIGVRMLMDLTWGMRRTGMVQWVSGTSW